MRNTAVSGDVYRPVDSDGVMIKTIESLSVYRNAWGNNLSEKEQLDAGIIS